MKTSLKFVLAAGLGLSGIGFGFRLGPADERS